MSSEPEKPEELTFPWGRAALYRTAPHMFVRIAFDILDEVEYEKLILLSDIVIGTEQEKRYRVLVDALIKAQWAKLAGIEAVKIEKSIINQFKDERTAYDFIGQAQHSKALFDFIAHVKASLDSIAVFLNDILNLERGGGDRDFRRKHFKSLVTKADAVLGASLTALTEWLDKDSGLSASIIAIRDRWLHQEAPSICSLVPPTGIGYFPVPKCIKLECPPRDTPTSETHWSTLQFIELHYSNLCALLSAVVDRCIKVESMRTGKEIKPRGSIPRLSLFPMKPSKDHVQGAWSVRKPSRSLFNANRLLEEFGETIRRNISKEAVETFRHLVRRRYVYFVPNGQWCVFNDPKGSLCGLTVEQCSILEDIGLVMHRGFRLPQRSVFVGDTRGLALFWHDQEERIVPVIILTQLGAELAKLVPFEHDETYIRSLVEFFTGRRISIEVLAVSARHGTELTYDSMGVHEYDRSQS